MNKSLSVLLFFVVIAEAVYLPTSKLEPISVISRDVVAAFDTLPSESKVRFIAPIIHDTYTINGVPIDTEALGKQLNSLYERYLKERAKIALSPKEAASFYYAYAVFIQKSILPGIIREMIKVKKEVQGVNQQLNRVTVTMGDLSRALHYGVLSEDRQKTLKIRLSELSNSSENLNNQGIVLHRKIRAHQQTELLNKRYYAELLQRLASSHRERQFPRGAVIFAYTNLAVFRQEFADNLNEEREARKDMDLALQMITSDLFEDTIFLDAVFERAKRILGTRRTEERTIYKNYKGY